MTREELIKLIPTHSLSDQGMIVPAASGVWFHLDDVLRVVGEAEARAAELEDRDDALDKIEAWCKAYPLAVFPEPDWGEVRQKLGDTLLTRVSGSNMRHVITGVQNIIDAALRQKEGER